MPPLSFRLSPSPPRMFLLLRLLLLLLPSARAQDNDRPADDWPDDASWGLTMDAQGFINGPPGAIETRGDFTYVGADRRLDIWDRSDPAHPRVAGSINTGRRIVRIHLEGPAAYLISRDERLGVVDVSDPTHPVMNSGYCLTAYRNLSKGGNFLMSCGKHPVPGMGRGSRRTDFSLFDISVPLHPVEISLPIDEPFSAVAAAFSDSRALTVQNDREGPGPAWVDVCDLSHRAAPKMIDKIPLKKPVDRSEVSPLEAVLGPDAAPIYLFEEESLNLPDVLHAPVEFWTLTNGERHGIDGVTHWLKTAGEGWRSESLAFPTRDSPAEAIHPSPYPVLAAIRNVYPVNGGLLIHDGGDLHLVDFADPSRPHYLARCPIEDGIGAVATQASFAFALGANGAKLWVLDLSHPSAPKVISTFAPAHPAERIAVGGGRAALADEHRIELVDVADPAHLKSLGLLEDLTCVDFHIQGSILAYTSSDREGESFNLTDVSDPANPVDLSSTESLTHQFALAGSVAVACDRGGFGSSAAQVIDIKDPAHPRIIDTVGENSEFVAIAAGRLALVSSYHDSQLDVSSLVVRDFGDPSKGSSFASWTIGPVTDVALDARFAYLADRSTGFHAYALPPIPKPPTPNP